MLEIKKNKISMIKGDTTHLNVSMNGYTYSEGDTITLTLKQSIEDEAVVLQKTVAANQPICLVCEDTNAIAAGRYVYDIQLDTAAGEVYTVVNPNTFTIKEGVNCD